MQVRILKNWRGLACGVFAHLDTKTAKDALSEGAACDKADPKDYPNAKIVGEPIDEPEKKAK